MPLEVLAPQQVPPLAVSVSEAGKLVGISGRTLQKHIAAGELPSCVIGGRRVLRLSTLNEWLARHEGTQRPEGLGVVG